jgi:hypothetical protein
MWKKQPFPVMVFLLGILLVLMLACRITGDLSDENFKDIPEPQEHISQEQLQETIKKTQEAYFSEDFNGQKTYASLESANPDNNAECDSGFPAGSNLIVKQHFYPGESERNRVVLWIDGETRIYNNTGKPYEFCRNAHIKKLEEGDPDYDEFSSNQVQFEECLTFQNGGFDLTVQYWDQIEEEYVECYWDEFHPTEAAAVEYQTFNGQWTSSEECENEKEFPYTWTVALTTDEAGNIVGTIRFHTCGGGNIVYSVKGEVDLRDPSGVYLTGDLITGVGDLYDAAPIDPVFYYEIGKPPEPNLGGK